MSLSGDDGLDRDEQPQLSPSAFLDAPSSQVEAAGEKPSTSQLSGVDENVAAETYEGEQDYGADEVRENRFIGNEATWRQYTANERGLIASLDQQRAGDLGIHLYNAHALKKRLYDPGLAGKAQPWQSKSLWMQKDANGNTPWHPDQNWTAWPLAVADVPRKEEHFGQEYPDEQVDGQTYRKAAPWRPSGDLQEEVQALMLRKAKERFRRRAWMSATNNNQADPLHGRKRSRSKSTQRSTSLSRRGSDASNVSAPNEEMDRDDPASKGLSASTRAPEFLADEDRAHQLLGQSTRHVLSNLDKLLIGLQRSRRGYGGHNPSHGQNPRTLRRKRKAEANKIMALGADDAIAGAAAAPFDKQQKDHESDLVTRSGYASGKHVLGARDWSEVIGIAALTGWDSAVLDRAAKRCAALFGENMTLKSMPETAAEKVADQVMTYTPELVPDFSLSDDSSEDDSEEAGFACPESTCPRASQPFELRWRLREHLKKKHGYTQEDLDDFDEPGPSSESVLDEQEHQNVSWAQTEKEIVSGRPGSGAVRTNGFLQTVDIVIPNRDNRKRQRSSLPQREHEATQERSAQEPQPKKQKSKQPSQDSS